MPLEDGLPRLPQNRTSTARSRLRRDFGALLRHPGLRGGATFRSSADAAGSFPRSPGVGSRSATCSLVAISTTNLAAWEKSQGISGGYATAFTNSRGGIPKALSARVAIAISTLGLRLSS